MIEYTRTTMPAVPAGMMRLTEYGRSDPSLLAGCTFLGSAPGAMHGFPSVSLCHWTRGYVVAGSALRWDEACWRVSFTVADGGEHGRRFAEGDEDAARAYFAELTDGAKVSAMRQAAAQRDDEEREARKAGEAFADGIAVEAAKTYRSGWQWKADLDGYRDWCGFAKTKALALAQAREAMIRRAGEVAA